MSDFRIKYGFALGPYGTAGATSAQNVFTPGDTTPEVTNGTFFVTANTSATIITYFDIAAPSQASAAANNGKLITILFQDNNTTIANAGQISMAGTGGAASSGQTMTFVLYNSAWFQLAGAGPVGRSYVLASTVGATIAPNIQGVSVLILNATAATTLIGLSGGVIGQDITIMKATIAAGTAVTVTGAANFMLANTNSFIMNDSAAYRFVNDGTNWRQVGGPAVP